MKEILYDFTAGWCGGASSLIIGHPLDTIKVRLQSLKYAGIYDCILRTLRTEGALALYKGIEFPLLSVGLINALYFGGYSTLKPNFNGEKSKENQISSKNLCKIAIAGAFGGAVQWTLACPVDVIKVKLQVQTTTEKFRGPFHCLRWILMNYGVRKGIFRAGTVMLIRDVIAGAAYIACYEALMDTFCLQFAWNYSISAMIAGGTAGVLNWQMIVPLDVVKSRLQADDFDKSKYRSAWHCACESYKEDGFRVFFRGSLVLAIRAFPLNAVLFLVYSHSLRLLNRF